MPKSCTGQRKIWPGVWEITSKPLEYPACEECFYLHEALGHTANNVIYGEGLGPQIICLTLGGARELWSVMTSPQ